MIYRFIGGNLDGTRRSVQAGYPHFRRPIYPTVASTPVFCDDVILRTVSYETYNKLNIAGIEIFAEASLSVGDVMRLLVGNYRGRSA